MSRWAEGLDSSESVLSCRFLCQGARVIQRSVGSAVSLKSKITLVPLFAQRAPSKRAGAGDGCESCRLDGDAKKRRLAS